MSSDMKVKEERYIVCERTTILCKPSDNDSTLVSSGSIWDLFDKQNKEVICTCEKKDNAELICRLIDTYEAIREMKISTIEEPDPRVRY